MTAATVLAEGTPLTEPGATPPYVLLEHVLAPGTTTPYRCHGTEVRRTFILIDGSVTLESITCGGERSATPIHRLTGWHAPPGSVFRVHADDAAVLVEAGTGWAGAVDSAQPPVATADCLPASSYQVDKPWGHEIWYTQNLGDPGYAFKQIHMTAGHQSSLQSHEFKVETNYVVDGEATVLNGLPAPADRATVIDVGQIPVRTHPARTGWSSAAGILHRVIARSDYTSVEVSTPELDDVIRWQDDSGRTHGRIAEEHRAAIR